MKQIRKRLTYANVMSTVAVFLVLGGATALAAGHLGKNSVGSRQLRANAVTQAKIRKNAVTRQKLKKSAVTTDKIASGAVTGEKVNLTTLGTVPNSATTNVVRTAKGVIALGGQATALEYGPLKVIVKCEVPTAEPAVITSHAFIESSTPGSVFTSYEDGSSDLGPATPEEDRELSNYQWADSKGPFGYDSPSDVGFSALANSGASFNASVGLASQKNLSTCWYWMNATILG